MPALLKFNLRDAGTLIGLLIIVVTFSFLSPVVYTAGDNHQRHPQRD
jgi:ribose transport system permease protein